MEELIKQTAGLKEAEAVAPHSETDPRTAASAGEDCGCKSVASVNPSTTSFVYVIGRIEPRFANLASEKEFAQAAARMETAGQTDQQRLYAVLSERQNRYLLREICWVLVVQGLETYLLLPRDPTDFDLLVNAIRPVPNPSDIDVVIGVRGPVAPPEFCNGLLVPFLIFDQLYSFRREELIASMPTPRDISADEFRNGAEQVFNTIIQFADNAGATNEHRALNYCTVRYRGFFDKTVEQFHRNFSLTGVEARPSGLSGSRAIVDVVFSYARRDNDFTEKYFVRIDVTHKFPFLMAGMAQYYDH